MTGALNFGKNLDATQEVDYITIDTTALNEEEVEDVVAALITGDTGVGVTYDDANDTLTIDINSHTSTSDAHHTKYTDSDAESAINNDADHGSTASHNYFSGSHADLSNVGANDHHQDPTAGKGITDEGTNQFGLDVAATGNVTLSSGSATIDTGIGSGTTATFMIAIGPTTDDAQVAADIQAVSGGNYTVEIEETDTSVGNPTVEYDVIRVR